LREKKKDLIQEGFANWPDELYRRELMSSTFVQEVLADAKIAQPLMFNGDYSYVIEQKYGCNYALIGDASTFIDPIFASGVYLSINSAHKVSEAIIQILNSKGERGETLLESVYSQINGAYSLVDKAIRLFYNPHAINFAQVGSAQDLIHQQHTNALAVGHYLLAGDFFNRYEQYSRFIDLLQDEKLYRRYKRSVIDRDEFVTSSCGTSRMEVFSAFLEQLDDKRNEKVESMGTKN